MSSVYEARATRVPKPVSPGGDTDAPVLLATLYDRVEAEIIVAKLRSAGIDCYLRHEAAVVVYGLTVDGIGTAGRHGAGRGPGGGAGRAGGDGLGDALGSWSGHRGDEDRCRAG